MAFSTTFTTHEVRCETSRLISSQPHRSVTMVAPILETAMSVTTSLKLPDTLKASIAKVAAIEGKTAHALMVETLQSAMHDALARQQFYADGEAAYQDTLRSNKVYRAKDVKAFVLEKVRGGKPAAPKPFAFDPSRPMTN